MVNAIIPSPAQLATAFADARKPHWPADLAAALEHPIYGRLVRMHARHLAMGMDDFADRHMHRRPEVMAPAPPVELLLDRDAPPAVRGRPFLRSPPKPPARKTQQPSLFDGKRAAAGERFDDD